MNKDLMIEIKKLAEEIILLTDDAELELLFEKVTDIYEKIIVLKHSNKEQEFQPIEETEHDNLELEKPSMDEADIELTMEEEILEVSSPKDDTSLLEDDSEIIVTEETKTPDNEDIKKDPVSLNDLFVPTFDSIKDDMSQKEEFKDTVSLEETEKLFETAIGEAQQLSLNDKLLNSSIQIGLNDRIAFVNHLFNFSQSEFNKTLSSLNACKNKQEALNYIHYSVKPNYNWKGKEELEERLILIIERKFL
jgi:hypothetical protein